MFLHRASVDIYEVCIVALVADSICTYAFRNRIDVSGRRWRNMAPKFDYGRLHEPLLEQQRQRRHEIMLLHAPFTFKGETSIESPSGTPLRVTQSSGETHLLMINGGKPKRRLYLIFDVDFVDSEAHRSDFNRKRSICT